MNAILSKRRTLQVDKTNREIYFLVPGNVLQKKHFRKFIAMLFIISTFCSPVFSQPTSVCVLTGSGPLCTFSSIGTVNPCSQYTFIVNYSVPLGYVFASKYEWYANNVLVATVNATTVNDNILSNYIINALETEIVCDVTFRKSNGDLSAPQRSDPLTIYAKPLNYDEISGPAAIDYGNQSPVSYSILPGTCSQFCYSPPPNLVSVTWQTPANWTQNSSSGMSASFTPDLGTAGTMTANIHLNATGCTYSESRTMNISRIYPAPTFATPNPAQVCSASPSGTYSINPQSLAANYTYTIDPYNGSGTNITFAANGQQTLTTTATSVSVNFNTQEDQIIFLRVVANYANGTSTEASLQIIYIATENWNGDITWEPECMQACNTNTPVDFHATATYIPGATYYWYMDGFLMDIGVGNTTSMTWHGESMLQVKAVTACASTDLYSEAFPISCFCNSARSADNGLSLYPNPAKNEVLVSLKAINTKDVKSKLISIKEIRILDKFGAIKQRNKYSSGIQTATLNINSLTADIYVIEISDGINKISKQFSKIK